MLIEASITFSTPLPTIKTIVEEVEKLSGLEIDCKDQVLSHPRLKNDVSLYYYYEEKRIGVTSGQSTGFYLEAVTIRSLLNLGGRIDEKYRFPKWSLKKLDEIRWWEFPKL